MRTIEIKRQVRLPETHGQVYEMLSRIQPYSPMNHAYDVGEIVRMRDFENHDVEKVCAIKQGKGLDLLFEVIEEWPWIIIRTTDKDTGHVTRHWIHRNNEHKVTNE